MNTKENELQDSIHDDSEVNEQNIEKAAMNFNADDSLAGTSRLNDEMTNNNNEEETDNELSKELAETKDKYIRLVAEFDNFRKRTSKEKVELIKNAGEDIIKSLLEVLDDSDRALQQMETSNDINIIKEGIALVFTKLRNTLQSKGLKVMESQHTDFDPELHEAITEIPAPTEELKGKVVDEVVKGYSLNDKIIRHAKVVVGK